MAENQQGAMPNTDTTETVVTTEGSKSSVTLESLQAELVSATKRIAELNKESEKHRKEADSIKAAKQADEEAKKSETEKLADKLAALTREKDEIIQKANSKLIKAEILARSSRFIDSDVILAIIDKSRIEVKDDGTVEGIEALLDEIAKNKPHLLKQKSQTLDATNPGAGATSETMEQRRARIFGAKTSPFDASFTLKQGGGIVTNQGD